MKTIRLLSCPLEAHFHFYNACEISCLYNSTKCKYNCMQLGTTQASNTKALSLAEILYYKSDKLPTDITLKTINVLKKEATTRIQNLYAFNSYLDFIRTRHYNFRLFLVACGLSSSITSTRLKNILNRYPYNVPLFKFTFEDLVLVLTEKFFEEFKKSKKLTDELTYSSIICITSDTKLRKARKVLAKYLKQKEIDYEFREEEN